MKKKLSLGLALSMILILGLTSCGGSGVKLYDYDLSKYVTVGTYKGLEVEPLSVKVTDEDIAAEVQKRLAENKTTEDVKTGIVKDGDVVNIDFSGSVDGQPPTESTTSGEGGFDLTIGSGQFIPGFEEGLIGVSVGSKTKLNLKFPDDYHAKDIAGKPVVFDVTVNSLRVDKLPAYNLDFVTKNSSAKTIEEYEKSIAKELEAAKVDSAKSMREQLLWEKVMSTSKVIKYPDKEKEAYKQQFFDYYESMATQYGMSLEDFLKQGGIDQEAYEEEAGFFAENTVFNEMVLFSIARTEKLEITDKEYKDGITRMLEKEGFASEKEFKDKYKKSFEEYVGKERIMTTLTTEKVMAFISENSGEAKK